MTPKPTYQELEEKVRQLGQAELKYQSAEAQIRNILESITDGFFACDADWRFVYVNRQAELILNIRADEVMGKNHWDVFPLALGTNLEREYRRAAAGEIRDFENFYEPWARWFHNRCYPREGGGMVVYFLDITERKREEREAEDHQLRLEAHVGEKTQELRAVNAQLKTEIAERAQVEQRLRESEEQFRSIFENALHGILFSAPGGQVYAANRAACDMLGRSEQEICKGGRNVVVDPSDPLLLAALEERQRTGRFMGELTYKRKDGSLFPVEISSAQFSVNTGDERACIIFRDISRRKKAEQAMQKSEERLALAMAATRDAIWDWDIMADTFYYSPRWWEMLGYPKDMQTTDPRLRSRLVHPDDLERISTIIRGALAGKNPFEFECRLVHNDGHYVPIRSQGTVQRNPAGEAIRVTGTIADLSRQKKREEEHREWDRKQQQLRKAESLSRMAGAIAHRYNNLLGAVIGNLDLAVDSLPPSTSTLGYIREANQAAHQAAKISSLMLTYLGQTVSTLEPVDLAELCRKCLSSLQATLPEGLDVAFESASPGPAVYANATLLRQVIHILITNSMEAMADTKGRIQLTVKSVSATAISATHRFPIDWLPTAKVFACLEVKDAGRGIRGEDIEQIFDPFYSTKFTGRGLGLAVLLGIVRGYQGVVTVESELRRGTVFRVFLPLSEQSVQVTAYQPPPVAATAYGGTVLLVEDEEPLRRAAKDMLSLLGFTVLTARDGAEAIKLFRDHQNEIRGVLCDLTMPRLNGWETLQSIRSLRPDIPAVIASGYEESMVMAGADKVRPEAFLQKPYDLKTLRETVKCFLVPKSGSSNGNGTC